MAKEILAIPEEILPEVIEVILAGLEAMEDSERISDLTRLMLAEWYKEEIDYLRRLMGLEDYD